MTFQGCQKENIKDLDWNGSMSKNLFFQKKLILAWHVAHNVIQGLFKGFEQRGPTGLPSNGYIVGQCFLGSGYRGYTHCRRKTRKQSSTQNIYLNTLKWT